MKLALAYSTKDRVDNTAQTFAAWRASKGSATCDLHWFDGSTEQDALDFFEANRSDVTQAYMNVGGGADAAIVAKLSALLSHPNNYTHVGLFENDVLLDKDWLEPTMALFRHGRAGGLEVGAVSPRSYVDRILIQRDGYAVMHNLGAGFVIYTREAARIVLDEFRTHWAPHIRNIWMRISGIDIGRYWAFRGNAQWVTSDWGYDAQLASCGLASLALTPARCDMVGQVPPLEQQGLQLVREPHDTITDGDMRFVSFAEQLRKIRHGELSIGSPAEDYDPCIDGNRIIFPHQAQRFFAKLSGDWRLQWSQGFGPFVYRAGPGGASLVAPVYGSCSFLVSGGASGARCRIHDATSGYMLDRDLPSADEARTPLMLTVPGAVTYREISLSLGEGGVFYGYSSPEQQPWDPTFRFDYSQLPPV